MRIEATMDQAALAAAVREAHPAVHDLYLGMGDCVIEIRANQTAMVDKLSAYFKEFLVDGPAPGTNSDILVTVHEAPTPELPWNFEVKQPDPGKTKIKEEWYDFPCGRIVRKRLTGMIFVMGGGSNVAVGPCLDNDNQVVNFINNRFIEMKLNQGCLLGHAAGVAFNGRGLSMAGFSGMGKSTLALHLMSRGTDFVSNDRIMVGEGADGLTMYGVAKHPRINPGTALNNPDLEGIVAPEDKERFLDMAPDELWALEHKYDALIDECYAPNRFRLMAPMDGLALLNWKRDAGPMVAKVVDPAERTDLLPAFMKGTGLFFQPEDGVPRDQPLEAYARALSGCTVIEFSGGVDFDAAADICLAFLKSGEVPGA